MPADSTDHRRLATLAALQRLRLAREEMALGEAREALREAQEEARVAGAALAAREAELERLLADVSFAPDRLLLHSTLLRADADAAGAADGRMDAAAMVETERSGGWKASRRQHEQLQAAQRTAERRSARKAEERALAALPFPLAAMEAPS